MTIPFVDYSTVNGSLLEDFQAAMKEVFDSGEFVHGPQVLKFEEQFSKFIQTRHCITVGSGTDAMVLALRVLGLTAGDEVICPAFGATSTAEAVVRAGGTPVFVDCRPESYTLDPDKTLASISSRTKAVIPVHQFGHACEIERIVSVARTYSVAVIEDCRSAIGGKIGHRRLGTYGDMAVYSFHPSSPLGGLGDGGAITTHDENRANLLRKLRDRGRATGSDLHELIGYYTLLDSLAAVFLSLKLEEVDDNNGDCIANAGLYERLFRGSPVTPPQYSGDGNYVYNSYAVAVPEREALTQYLKEKNIGFQVPYAAAPHLQPCFAYLGYREGAFPIAEDLTKRVICLPVWPGLKQRHVREVAEAVLSHYGAKA